MTKFIVIEKDSLNKATIDTAHISLNEASIVHTKMSRDDVAEFVRDGNNLVLKLKNGETIVIEGFFITYDDVSSDLVFEEDGCVLYWFDGASGFNHIPGLEVLLPEAGSKLIGLLPWLVGAGVIGGVIAATNDDDKKENIPNGTNKIGVETNGTITGKTENVPEGTEVKITITGQDKDGKLITHEETVKVDKDGNYTTDVPPDFADGELEVKSEVIDRNGNTVKAEDSLEKTDHDNNPGTPDQGGLDRVDSAITVDIVESGVITGTTTDVAPNSNVVLTITGKDANGNNVTVTKTVTTDALGHYNSALTPADGIVDGSSVTVVATTTDRNGQAVPPATDSIAAQGDNDNDPSTPEDKGLDLVAGSITVDIVESGVITGTTTDVAPNSNVVLTITGKDANGNPVTVTKTVTTDASGHYNSALTPADGIVDGSAITVIANTTDRNGQGVGPATDSIAAQGNNDNDPSTPADKGLDLAAGSITVDIVESGVITGTTTDVAPNSNVVLTITGKDANGNPVTVTKTVTTDA
ncbi:MAG TPA: BapA prefix-like domain-containing protein, partial [Acinetobacter sp.]|nr:BapA prefix-like domain-containing protein [Acinetobacter sp.]